MFPTPAIAPWSRSRAFKLVRRLRNVRYSSSAANAGSMGSGPSRGSFFDASRDSSVPSSKRPNRRGSRYRSWRPLPTSWGGRPEGPGGGAGGSAGWGGGVCIQREYGMRVLFHRSVGIDQPQLAGHPQVDDEEQIVS